MGITEKGFDHIRPAHRIPRERKPIWDIETLADICKGALALALIGIGVGLVLASGRILWEVADQYAYAVALWISGAP